MQHSLRLFACTLALAGLPFIYSPTLATAQELVGNVEFHNYRGCGGTRVDSVDIYDDGAKCHTMMRDWQIYYWRPMTDKKPCTSIFLGLTPSLLIQIQGLIS
jgi:hypothetical protein